MKSTSLVQKRIDLENVFRLSPVIYIILLFSRFYFNNSEIYTAITATTILLGWSYLLVSISRAGLNSPPFRAIALIAAASFITIVAGQNPTKSSIIQLFSHIGFALAASQVQINYKTYEKLFLAAALFFVIYCLLGVNAEDIFIVSRNFVSIFLLLLVSFYYISCQQVGKPPRLWVPAFAFLIMLWAIGRAGIASSMLVLLLTAFFIDKRYLLVFSAIIAFGAAVYFTDNVPTWLNFLYVGVERFERLSGESQRNGINKEYLDAAFSSAHNALFGVPLADVAAIQGVGGNPHNAFISLHENLGLLGFMLVASLLTFSMWRIIWRKQYFVAIVFLACLFRSAFDSAAFHGPLDIVLFYCIFSALGNGSDEASRETQ